MSRFNFSNNPIKDWNSDQNWVLLDATSKGFFTQIVLLSSQSRPFGHFSSDEKKLKRLLGLPSRVFDIEDYKELIFDDKKEISKTIKKYFDENSNRFNLPVGLLESLESMMGENELVIEDRKLFQHYDLWINFLWEYKWKPALSTLMLTIDAELTLEFPELNDKIGDYFIPIAYNLGEASSNNSKKTVIETKKVKKAVSKNKALPFIVEENAYFDLSCDHEIKEEGLFLIELNLLKSFDFKNSYKCFTRPLSEKDKNTIWDLGVSLISNSQDEEDIKKANKIMSKAIKEYGRELTIAVITKFSLSKEQKHNPQAYFFKLLKIEKAKEEKENQKGQMKVSANQTILAL